MSNKIIYPALIIIFSILVIYAIINKWNNDKLNKNIESFMNNPINSNPNVELDLKNNNMATAKIASGNWTYPNYTVVDGNYNASKFMVIDASPTLSDNNYGTIMIDDDKYKIKFLLNMNLIAQKKNNSSHTLHIKFTNVFINEQSGNLFNNTGAMDCIVTTYINNNITSKFYSYKIEENPVSTQLYTIINTNDYDAQEPPEIYDLETYSVLMHNYTYSPNYIQLTYGGYVNKNAYNKLTKYYIDGIKFAIQRVFKSPTGNKITCALSNPIILPALQSNNIPNKITISSFQDDMNANNLKAFFQPDSVIVYFYKIIDVTVTYGYNNGALNTVSNSSFKLKNNATNMYKSNVTFNKLETVAETNTSNFQLQLIGTYQVDKKKPLESTITIPFSSVANLL
jgi:hypothetical protein